MTKRFLTLALAAMMTGMMFVSCTKDTVEDNSDTPDSATVGFDENGASYALFSVGEQKQVRFSCGNLQYQASTDTWRFAENQYGCVGDGNCNISATYDGWIDLFGWGTSGWEYNDTIYQPWDTIACTIGNDLINDYAEGDWGWHNAIQNGGKRVHLWRTLTYEEWNYLLSGRTDATSKCGAATVNEVHGAIILPDDWTTPDSLSFISGFNGWTTNQYTVSEWQRMEKSGAIFLPAAGSRVGTEARVVGTQGLYWSVSLEVNGNAKMVVFKDRTISAGYTSPREPGRSVRLAMDNN